MNSIYTVKSSIVDLSIKPFSFSSETSWLASRKSISKLTTVTPKLTDMVSQFFTFFSTPWNYYQTSPATLLDSIRLPSLWNYWFSRKLTLMWFSRWVKSNVSWNARSMNRAANFDPRFLRLFICFRHHLSHMISQVILRESFHITLFSFDLKLFFAESWIESLL